MIITKMSKPTECTVFDKSGHGKKEKDVPLFKIVVPAHHMVYEPDEDALRDEPIAVQVLSPYNNDFSPAASGSWPLATFSVFVDGVRAVTEAAIPYIRDCEDIVAQGKISETTYVWSKFEREKVSGGFMREEKHEYFQKVLFSVFDQQYGWARWDSGMLDSLVGIRDEITNQRQEYLREVRAKIGR